MTKTVLYMLLTAIYTSSWWYGFAVKFDPMFVFIYVFGTLGLLWILIFESIEANEK